MARINSYPLDDEISLKDKWIGTDGVTFVTKNFSVQQLFTYFQQNLSVDVQDIVVIEDHEARLDEIETEFTIVNSDITGLSAASVIKSYVDTEISGINQITTDQANKIAEAHGWGNHALAGYITTETDPTVPSHVKSITTTDISNWNSGYNNAITGISVTGDANKTITLNQQDGSTLTANFADISGGGGGSDTNYYLSGGSLSGDTLTLNVTGAQDVQVSGFSTVDSINDLSDVVVGTPTDGQVLAWNNTNSYWAPANAATPVLEGNLTIGDTEGVIADRVNAGTTTNVIVFNESADGQSDTVTVSASTYTGFAGSTPEFAGTFQGNVKGQVYNPDGSVLALYTASGGSATPILQGNISGDIITATESGSGLSKVLTAGTTIFDSSEVAFTTDLNIGTPVFDSGLGQNVITTNYDIDLGVTSQIYFGRHIEDGQGVSQEEYIDASKISTWDSSVITTLYYDLVNYDTNTQLGDIQLRLVKNNDPNDYVTTSNNITGGTYIDISFTEGDGESNGPDSNDPITLDVNTTALDLLYVNVDGDTMSGMLQFSGANGVAGDIYADNLQTRLLNNGTVSGSTYQEDSWFRGDLYHQGGALELSIGDTSNGPVFQRGLDITTDLDVGGDLDLTQSSTIVFDRGANQTSITKVDVSNFKSAYGSWVRNIEYLTGDGTAVTFTDLNSATANADSIDIKLKGETTDDDRILSNRIYGSKYIDLTADANNDYYSISVDLAELNNTNDARYVEVAGDTMTGTLTVSGAAAFIEGKAKTDLYKSDGTLILDTDNEWFKGDLRGGDLQDVNGTNIFTSSTSTFASSITIEGESITLGANPTSLSASELSTIKNNVVESIKFEKVSGSEEIRLVIDNPTATDLNSQTVLKAGEYINITEDGNTPANPIIAADTASSDGLATKGYVSTALGTVVTGIAIDNTGTPDSATNGEFTFIAGSNISISRDGTSPNDITFDFNNTGTVYLTANTGIRHADFSTEGLMKKNAGTNSYTTITDNSSQWGEAYNKYATGVQFVSGTGGAVSTRLVKRDATTVDTANNITGSSGITVSASSNVLDIAADTSVLASKSYLDTNFALKTELPSVTDENNWNTAYNDSITSIELITAAGADAGKIKLTQQDNGTLFTQSLDNRYAIDGSHLTVVGVPSNVDESGNTFIQDISFDTYGHVIGIATGSVSGFLALASGDTPATNDIAQFDLNGDIVSTGVASFLNTNNVVRTTQSPNFGSSNTVTAADFILFSDRDLKENIIPLAERKIDVDFKEYNFKGSKRTRFGVIAQELEEKHPEFVHTRESGDKSVSYIDLLVAKVHELENRIKELENGSRDR